MEWLTSPPRTTRFIEARFAVSFSRWTGSQVKAAGEFLRQRALSVAVLLVLLPALAYAYFFGRWMLPIFREAGMPERYPLWELIAAEIFAFVVPALVFVMFAAFDQIRPGKRGAVLVALVIVSVLWTAGVAIGRPAFLGAPFYMLVGAICFLLWCVALLNLSRLLPANLRVKAFVLITLFSFAPTIGGGYSMGGIGMYQVLLDTSERVSFFASLSWYTLTPIVVTGLAALLVAQRYLESPSE